MIPSPPGGPPLMPIGLSHVEDSIPQVITLYSNMRELQITVIYNNGIREQEIVPHGWFSNASPHDSDLFHRSILRNRQIRIINLNNNDPARRRFSAKWA